MNFYNRVLDKKGLKRIVSWFIENYGPTRTSLLLDDFKYIGFHYASRAGLSLGFDDLRIPDTKKNLLDLAQQQVQDCEKTYVMGRITAFEKYQKLIDIWTTTSEKLKDEVIQNFEKIQGGPLASPLYMMAFSGARGNISQVRQLVGMRGLMSDSGGGIIDFPIRSNFREGLSVTEYVISCYGARKGLIDTALRTADSGYLTRRLVDVAHGIIIREIDCGSSESIVIKITDLKNLIGRVLAETIQNTVGREAGIPRLGPGARARGRRPKSHAHMADIAPSSQSTDWALWRNQPISPSIALQLKSIKGAKASVQVRSPLTCLSQSVCQLCYGWNLAQGRLVSLGDAVGILAAQSIGEPGTQLTMRTFHTGGIFSTEVEDKIFCPQEGQIYVQKKKIKTEPPARGCKIRSVHGRTAFFFFDSVQLKIKKMVAAEPPVEATHLPLGPSGSGGWLRREPFGSSAGEPRGRRDGQSPSLPPATFSSEGGGPADQKNRFFQTGETQKLERASSLVHTRETVHSEACDESVESIVQLPPQSILFVSPGKTILKNTLCAEISRIKPSVSPPLFEKTQESLAHRAGAKISSRVRATGNAPRTLPQKVQRRGPRVGSLGTAPVLPRVEDTPPLALVRSGGVSSTGDLPSFGPREAKPILAGEVLAQKKVFSEIQGEVREENQVSSGRNMGFRAGTRDWTVSGHSSRPATPIILGHADVESSYIPEGASASKSRIVLAGEPFRFQRELHRSEPRQGWVKGPHTGADAPSDERSVVRGLGDPCATAPPLRPKGLPSKPGGLDGKSKMNLPFRAGDIVFWKGKRQMRKEESTWARKRYTIPVQGITIKDTRNSLDLPNLRREARRTEGLPSNISHPLRVVFAQAVGVFEGRAPVEDWEAQRAPVEATHLPLGPSGSGGWLRREGGRGTPAQHNNSPCFEIRRISLITNASGAGSFSGLVSQFIQQKEKNIEKATAPRHSPPQDLKRASAQSAEPEGPKGIPEVTSARGEHENDSPNQSLGPRVGQILQPHIASSSVPRPALLGALPTGGSKGMRTSALNIPSQIIRKRQTKIILRRVQLHLGGQIKDTENVEGKHPHFVPRYVKERELLFQLILPISQSSSSSDIVQGLPKIEQLFEARSTGERGKAPAYGRPPSSARSAPALPAHERSGGRAPRGLPPEGGERFPSFGREGLAGRSPASASALRAEGLQPQARKARGNNPPQATEHLQADEMVFTAELRELQKRLIQEIQLVYNSQGVDIADKHLEIIVRQMTSRVRMLEKGKTPFFPDDIIEAFGPHGIHRQEIVSSTLTSHSADGVPQEKQKTELSQQMPIPPYEWILLGITKVALLATTESYISAASFQETKRVLMTAALQNRVDFFEGLKENVIVGRIIPAGTGAWTISGKAQESS